MASQTIASAPWAPGTLVSVYPAAALPAGVDAPSGSAVTTATVSAGQSVTFTGLSEGIRYVAYAGGVARRFLVPFSSGDLLEPMPTRVSDLEVRATSHESRLGVVESGSAGTLVATNYGVTTAAADIGPSLQTLLNTAAAAGQRVYMPAGTYTLGTAVAIPAGTHLFGDGATATKIKLASAFPTSHPLYNAVTTGFNDIYIHDLELDGNAAGQTGDQSINGNPNELLFLSSASGTPGSNIVVERVYAHDSYRLGIVLQNIDGGAVRQCRVKNNGRDGITLFDACKRIVISGNRVSGCNDDHIALDGQASQMTNIVVADNVITGPGARGLGKGIRVQGVKNVSVTGNVIDSVSEVGIHINDYDLLPCENVTISGNTISNTGSGGSGSKVGILAWCGNASYPAARSNYAGIKELVISANTIEAAGGNGIELRTDHADYEFAGCIVQGNNIAGCSGHGIVTTTGSTIAVCDLTVMGNASHGNTDHGIFLNLPKGIICTGNRAYNNGSGGVNTSGFRFVCQDVFVYSGNVAYETRTAGARTQTVGHNVVGASALQAIVHSNIANNNVTTQYSTPGVPGLAAVDSSHSSAPTIKGTLAANATDLATVITLANDLKSKLQTAGVSA